MTLRVAQVIADQVIQAGGEVPEPITGLALIDTGATLTCVDETAARQVGAPVIDVTKMSSTSDTDVDANVYPISFLLTGLPTMLNTHRAIGADLQAHDLILLIGRDLLQFCTLHYNGPNGAFTLAQ